jgi:hypothetical protein
MMPKKLLRIARVRLLTDNFDNKQGQWLACYEIPVRNFLNKEPAPIASPPASNYTK